MKYKVYNILNSKSYTNAVLLFNVLMTFSVMYFMRKEISPDHFTYMYYVKGLEQGRYTYWWNFSNYIPDTFRNPGYPFLLYILAKLSDNRWVFVIAQTGIYFVSIYYLLRIIKILFPKENRLVQNIFLTVLGISIVIPYYTSLIFPEITMLFLIVFTTYYLLIFDKDKWQGYIVLGLLYGLMFQIRPVVLFLPFLIIAYLFIQYRGKYLYKYILMLCVYVFTMLPYGCWNLKQHGVFSVTPLEGGGGAMYLGYWSYKMPGYIETRYWYNKYEKNIISFVEDKDVNNNIVAFNKEWDYIDSACAKYLTAQDTLNVKIMRRYTGSLFITYNGTYTYEREKLLKKLAVQHYLDEPSYTFKVKLYTFFRLWFAGLDKNFFLNKPSFIAFVLLVLPFLVTFPAFLLFVLFVPYAIFRRKIAYKEAALLLITMAYFGLIHLPFVLQSRYTIPVRPFMYILISIAICRLFFNSEKVRA
ncbi:MAG TPA: glycosyltransferase family 39 protein [Chitinophagales bacterium]|nr:glycosyltransferase family 39 protein [Chitinophagales bacterium]